MFKKLLLCACGTSMADVAPFVLRIVTGLIFAMHGWQKLGMGVPMIAGFLGTLGFPFPTFFAIALIAAELAGGVLLIIGALTHWTAKLLAFVALVALLTVHVMNGFFLSNGGYEFILLILAASISLIITGAGKWSVDGLFKKASHSHHGHSHDHAGHNHA